MSQVFEGYERQYWELSANLSPSLFRVIATLMRSLGHLWEDQTPVLLLWILNCSASSVVWDSSGMPDDNKRNIVMSYLK
ncbi:uncharacterized protein G2W53_010844 [Senna tora]|uniref:Uncharacterized protein n=1 Tax=Senna tora TaxID=362788 RepID=A0A834X017_9FABA|nr:uncharacterized protein G2W53_010844 [Senna tora]